VPAGKVVRIVTTATDVIHAFDIPSFRGECELTRRDAGTKSMVFKADAPGTYYGQCAKICGFDHAYMPIEIKVLTPEDYAVWNEGAKKQFGALEAPASTRLAASTLNTAR